MHQTFLYIFFLPSLHDYNVKVPNFTFCAKCEHKTTTFFFFSWTSIQYFRIQLQKNLLKIDELNEMEYATCCDNHIIYLWRSFPFFPHNLYVMLTLLFPRGNNTNFLLTTSIRNKENKKLSQLIKRSPKENALIFYQILSNKFLKEMYGDQSWEFLCGYWGF